MAARDGADGSARERSTGGSGWSFGGRPRTLVVTVLAVLAEAAAFAVLGVWWAFALVVGRTENVSVVLFLIVFALGVAALLALGARALLAGRRGARAPVITWQLLQGATAVAVLQGAVNGAAEGATPWLARFVLLVSAGVVVLMLTRPVVRATTP